MQNKTGPVRARALCVVPSIQRKKPAPRLLGLVKKEKKRWAPYVGEAVMASAELLRHFAHELIQRAAAVARQDGDDTVDGSHLERVLPQHLLDFAT